MVNKDLKKFKELGLSQLSIDALNKKGFEEPTPIQEKCIPILMEGKFDVIGQAQTGTGKTAAYSLPILENIRANSKKVRALILTPTRELAIQVSEELNSLKGSRKLKVTAIYGGQSIDQQINRLRQGVQIVVGTPGRIIDHINRKTLHLEKLKFTILDEADEMLNMGFIEDVEKILDNTPKEKRMLLFSATMPKSILSLSEKYMSDYKYVKIDKTQVTTNLADQIYFEVSEEDKFESLCRIIDVEPGFYGLVFCRTRLDVDWLSNKLIDRSYEAQGIHGDMSQAQREKIFKRFKDKKLNILVATDVAARGIDVNDLTHVINYSLPQNPESYVHRIGRTGRAGKVGTAITFITFSEYRRLMFIRNITKSSIRKKKVPEIQEVIDVKKDRVKTKIQDIILNLEHQNFMSFAEDLIEEKDHLEVIAALLKLFLNKELDEGSYKEIKTINIDRKGKNRLFVAKGKQNGGMTKKKLVEYISKKAKVPGFAIDDVRVYDDFSFISVPSKEAKIILDAFKSNVKGQRSIVVKAKEKKKK